MLSVSLVLANALPSVMVVETALANQPPLLTATYSAAFWSLAWASGTETTMVW